MVGLPAVVCTLVCRCQQGRLSLRSTVEAFGSRAAERGGASSAPLLRAWCRGVRAAQRRRTNTGRGGGRRGRKTSPKKTPPSGMEKRCGRKARLQSHFPCIAGRVRALGLRSAGSSPATATASCLLLRRGTRRRAARRGRATRRWRQWRRSTRRRAARRCRRRGRATRGCRRAARRQRRGTRRRAARHRRGRATRGCRRAERRWYSKTGCSTPSRPGYPWVPARSATVGLEGGLLDAAAVAAGLPVGAGARRGSGDAAVLESGLLATAAAGLPVGAGAQSGGDSTRRPRPRGAPWSPRLCARYLLSVIGGVVRLSTGASAGSGAGRQRGRERDGQFSSPRHRGRAWTWS